MGDKSQQVSRGRTIVTQFSSLTGSLLHGVNSKIGEQSERNTNERFVTKTVLGLNTRLHYKHLMIQ